MTSSSPRLYVTGRVAVETAERVWDEGRFPSRQARLLFACLALAREHDVAREALAEILWPEGTPAAWDSALKALVSKLRHHLDGSTVSVQTHFGCYRLELPSTSWLDWEAAKNAVDEAEGSLRAGDVHKAWGPVNIAVAIGKRGFLAGEHGEWVDARRRELNEILARGLTGYAEIALASNQAALAAQASQEAVDREPYRESGYQLLMRAHAALGNRAEALRVYHRCRELLSEELGVDPSPSTEAVYLQILKS